MNLSMNSRGQSVTGLPSLFRYFVVSLRHEVFGEQKRGDDWR